MLRASLLLFLFAVCSAAPSFRLPHPMPRIHGRIIGGVPVDISEYPWQLAVEDLSIHVCGASVISSTYALTAAHCIDDTDEEFVKLSVRAGTSSRESGGTVYEAADFFSHSRYKTWTSGYDIGVIEISGSFSFGENVQAVDLATTEPTVGTRVTTTGWGSASSGGSSPRQLQAVTTTIVSRATCHKHYTRIGWSITETMICAGDTRGGRDACQGDSGGPLVAGNTQYGIVSWGEGCGSATYPGVYSNIADLRDWIKGRTGV